MTDTGPFATPEDIARAFLATCNTYGWYSMEGFIPPGQTPVDDFLPACTEAAAIIMRPAD